MPRHRRESRYKRETPEEVRLRKDYAIEASFRNLAKAFASPKYHKPQPLRSAEESLMVRRFAWQWFTCRGNKPSARDWARQLGISHVWLLRLAREFTEDPSKMQEEARRYGDPTLAQLSRAQEYTRQMRGRNELRSCRATITRTSLDVNRQLF